MSDSCLARGYFVSCPSLAYHIPKALVRTSANATLSSLCVSSALLAEVCFDRTSLWACFGMMDFCRLTSLGMKH